MNIKQILMNATMLLSIVTGVWHLGHASWIYSKAYAATFLIDNAWQATLANNAIHKPWSWADTWPVADLSIPSINLKEIILAGDSGSSLAFGPGLSYAGATLDDNGVKLISGHRDTHFNKLQNINLNDAIFIKTAESIKHYKVKDIGVVDSQNYSIDADNGRYDLVLITCYPFNVISTGGSQRFIVQAIEL